MGRLTQAMGFINLDPEKLTPDWVKANLTKISVKDDLKSTRKRYLKEKKIPYNPQEELNFE